MFLISLEDEFIVSLKEALNDKNASLFYDELYQGKYKIYYSYDEKANVLLYEALQKETKEYHSLCVTAEKDIHSIGEKLANNYDKVFAYYIHNVETEKSKEELKEIYKEDYDALAPLASMDRKDILLRKEQLPLLKKLTEDLYSSFDTDTFNVDEKISITYVLEENYKEENYLLRLKVWLHQKEYLVKNTLEFLKKARDGGRTSLNKNDLYLSNKVLKDEDREAFSLLYQIGMNFGNRSNKDVFLSREEVCRLLFLLKGRTIVFESKKTFVLKEINQFKVQLGDSGRFMLQPQLYGKLFFSDLNLCIYKKEMNSFFLFSFKDEKEKTLIRFILTNPEFRFDLFQNEITSTLLPILNEEVQGNAEFEKNHPSKQENISYYVTYTDDDSLKFETKFYSDEKEISQTEFVSSYVGKKKFSQFQNALSFLSLPVEGEISDESDILLFLKTDLFPLKKSATVYLSDNLSKRRVKGVGKINVKVKSQIDWLDMELGSDQYTKDELEEILSAYRQKKKYVRLKDAFISFDEEDSSSFKELIEDFSFSSLSREKLPLYDVLKLSGYEKNDLSLLLSDEVKNIFDTIKNFKNLKIDLKAEIKKNLRPYQEDGVKWMKTLESFGLCGILADDMGLGKTLEIIALLSLSEKSKPILIICPKSLIFNWENEFKKWNPSQRVFVVNGSKEERALLVSQIEDDKKEVYITSYDSLKNDLDAYEKHSFSYLILDEGQNICNVYAKRTKAVKEVVADQKFVLTGTPIQNSLLDLWSIFDFLMPGYFSSYRNFSQKYGKMTFSDQEEKEELIKKVAPFILQRKKKDVLAELPDKEEKIITVEMNDKQKILYDASIQKARQSLNEKANKIMILSQITRLREICVDPKMFLDGFDDVSIKLTACLDLIRSSIDGGHKVIVFSTFLKSLHHLEEMLNEQNISFRKIYGDTKAKERIEYADDFNYRQDLKVMLVSLKAGGTGLNLIGGDIVILLDPWWNLASENQASDRAHRIGQKNKVTVLKLICKDSIEERVLQLQQQKKELSSLIEDSQEALSEINTDDLYFLLN